MDGAIPEEVLRSVVVTTDRKPAISETVGCCWLRGRRLKPLKSTRVV